MKTVTLSSQDGQTIEVKKEIAEMSVLIKEMTEEQDDEDENDDESLFIPLPNVKYSILEKIVEFCTYHDTNEFKRIPKPLPSTNMSEIVGEWDANYIDIDNEMLFELILGANYMDIKPLIELGCAKVASMIKGKSPEEIREKFKISNDFSEEEKQRIAEENKWCQDEMELE